jgi:2-(1,2-epoxy-1,2-dihydrophenyl)acetyl-CoA isomerase
VLELEIGPAGVAVATLNHPERGNCLSDDTIGELIAWIDEMERRDDVAVLVVEGQPRVFCGGGDVHVFRNWGDWTAVERRTYMTTVIQPLFRRLAQSPLLTVASVEGAVVGAGLDLLLACDLRFAATSATVRSGYLDVGLVPGAGSPWHLVRLLGRSRSLELLLSSEDRAASELAEWGLFSRIFEPEALRPAVMETCAAVAARGRSAVVSLKSLVHSAADESFDAHLEHAAALLALLGDKTKSERPEDGT